MGFRYELHCHTAEGSRCSRFPAVEAARYYRARGYDGIFITDHLTGSTTVPEGVTMAERMDFFARNGYEIAKAEGDRIGLKVFFALELSLRRTDGADPIKKPAGNDFLILGLSPAWWREQPEDFLYLPPEEQFDKIHADGGFVIHAHPFLKEDWIEGIRLFPKYTDAVELNRHAPEEANESAREYARKYGFPLTGGTDAHSADRILFGVETEKECFTDRDVIDAIRGGTAHPFRDEKPKEGN